MIMSSEPQQQAEGLAAAKNMREFARIQLQQIGLLDATDEQIEEAVKANDWFLEQLEAIKNRAQFGALDNGNRELGELN
jgi:hypothetical protein